MSRGIGGEGGARGGRDPNAGGGPRGGGSGNAGGGAGVGGQMQRNRQNEIARTARQTGAGTSQMGNSGRTEAGMTHDVFGGMGRDYRNDGSSFIDKVGNFLAGGLGFNEQAPTKQAALDRIRSTANPTQAGVDNRANWGFDPVTALAGLTGTAFGVPLTGFIGDQISSALGRPLEVGLGPDVFGGPASPVAPGDGSIGTASGMAATGAPSLGGGQSGLSDASLSYLTGRPVRSTGAPAGVKTPVDTATNPPGTPDPTPIPDIFEGTGFDGVAPAVAAARSPFNMGIGGLSGGGYAMGATKGGRSKRATTPSSLAEGLGRYRGPYEIGNSR